MSYPAKDAPDHVLGVRAGALVGELTLVFGPALLGQRPSFEAGKCIVPNPTLLLRVTQDLGSVVMADPCTGGYRGGVGEAEESHGVQHEQGWR